MEPVATPPRLQNGVAASRALELVRHAEDALNDGNVSAARTYSHTARLLLEKRTTVFLPETAARILFTSARTLHARAVLLRGTTERNAEIQFSTTQSPGLLRAANSRLKQALEAMSASPNGDPLMVARITSLRGLIQYDVSCQRGQRRKNGLSTRMSKATRAKYRHKAIGNMTDAVKLIQAANLTPTYGSLEVYLQILSCCRTSDKLTYLDEALEQCSALGLPRSYAWAHCFGRRQMVNGLARFYQRHTPVIELVSTAPTPQG